MAEIQQKYDRLCEFLMIHVEEVVQYHMNANIKKNMIKYQKTRDKKYFDKIYRLDLSGCKLDKLPGEISLLQNLISLDLVHNNLEELPVEFSSMTRLRILNLSGNKFKTVPVVISKMSIRQLYLYANPLKELPMFLDGINLVSIPYGAYWID